MLVAQSAPSQGGEGKNSVWSAASGPPKPTPSAARAAVAAATATTRRHGISETGQPKGRAASLAGLKDESERQGLRL